MAEKKIYKIIALIGAILIYALTLFTLVALVKSRHQDVKDFGYNVDDAIVVDLDVMPSKTPIPDKKSTPKKELVPKRVPQKRIVEPTPPSEEIDYTQINNEQKSEERSQKVEELKSQKQESRDIEAKSAKDLFSTMRAKDYNKVIEERKKQEAARASRLAKQKAAKERKKLEEKRRKKALVAAKALLQDLSSSTGSHQKRGEKDDFWSPVSSKIMAKWNRTISTQDGLSAVVKIRISNSGHLSYKIKRLSNNTLFDSKLKIFLENLEYERFPSYHGGPYIEADFIFKDQAK